VVFRLHHKRRYDFRRGFRLRRDDHVVLWWRPQRPDWMDEATYATIPESLTIREVRFNIDTPGCRSRQIVVATTLLDNRTYSSTDIADAFHQRWHAELDIRAIKRTLGMEMIHCKKPEMAHNALWAHLLGYNLARKIAAQAAQTKGLAPRQISFAGVVQILQTFRDALLTIADSERHNLCLHLFMAIAAHRVGDRPDRKEPRRLKRRHDKYAHMQLPRVQARAAAINGRE
jgi:hypothetical protein